MFSGKFLLDDPVVASQILARTGEDRLYLIVAQSCPIALLFAATPKVETEGEISLRAAGGQLGVIDRLCVFLWTVLVIRL